MNKYVRIGIFILISFALFFLPTLFKGSLYQVGGDDTRLYYIFPKEMLQHFAFNIVSNNSLGTNGGYSSMSFYAPILFVIFAVKTILPQLNTQMVLYGLNYALGFIYFYCFLGLWIKGDKETPFIFLSKIIASLFYVFSFFVIKTVYGHQLVAVYIISVFPATLYFFMQSLQKQNIYFAVVSAIIYSAFSSTYLSLPWYGAIAFSCIPMFFILMKRFPKQVVRSSIIFMLVFVCLNFYWLFHQLYPLLLPGGGSALQYVTSSTLRAENFNLIWALSHLNVPIHQMAAYIRTGWNERNNLGLSGLYGLFYILTIIFAGIIIPKKEKNLAKLYILSVTGLLLSFMLITPDLGDWNVNLFLWFNNHIPLFTMFRNMFDKFGVAVSFHFAFALFVSLVIISKKIRSHAIKYSCLIVLAFITVWNAHSYILSSKFAEGISGMFNDDYMSLTKYIKAMNEPSRFVWLPLNFASYSIIEDGKNLGHFYYGASPLQFLAESSDYTGFQSFSTAADSNLNFKLLGLLHEKNYEEIGGVLQRMNAEYVITYHYDIPAQYYDQLNFEGAIDQQTPAMMAQLKGEKIADFGSRYSLYEINKNFKSEKVFLADTFDVFPKTFNGLIYRKTSTSEYDVTITNPSDTMNIVFLEPYDRLWKLYAVDKNGNNCSIPNAKQTLAYRYGNGWSIPKEEVIHSCSEAFETKDGSTTVHMRIIFHAQQYTDIANMISLVAWGIAIFYVISMGIYFQMKKKL